MHHTEPTFTLEELEAQEGIEFEHFDANDAFDLGTITVAVIREWNLNLAVDIIIGEHHVYRAKIGADDGGRSDHWLPRKSAVARDFAASSLLVRFRHDAAGTKFTDLDVDQDAYAAYGGAVPIRVAGEVVGTLTTSGEADVVDHEVAVEAVRRYLAS